MDLRLARLSWDCAGDFDWWWWWWGGDPHGAWLLPPVSLGAFTLRPLHPDLQRQVLGYCSMTGFDSGGEQSKEMRS